MAYATLADLKAELSITATRDDALLTAKLEEAQFIIERTYNRRFEATAVETRLLDCAYPHVGDDGRTLLLPWDVCQIDEVRNGDGTVIPVEAYVTTPRLRSVADGASVAIDVPEWWPWYAIVLKAGSGLRWRHNGSPEEAIAITGMFAFSATPPANVRSATIRLAYWLYQQRDVAADVSSATVGKQGKVLLPAQLPQDVEMRLRGLRRL
jgi:hypothetical protein